MAYYDTYRDQLASALHGHALWVPDPAGFYDQVQVGEVGYVRQGHFCLMFNALLPTNHTQPYGVPEGFVPLDMGPFLNIRTRKLPRAAYCSASVTEAAVDHEVGRQAAGPYTRDEDTDVSFKCSRGNKGAALVIPFDGQREDAIRTRAFETYIHKHCDSWLEFASVNDRDVRLEDIILVTGYDLTSSWAVAAFVNSLNPEISLYVRTSEDGRAGFRWTVTNHWQPHHNESSQNVEKSDCVFLRGFRAKRILPFFKPLGPRTDNPDHEPESSLEHLREPAVPDYRDPLVGVLDYIAKVSPDVTRPEYLSNSSWHRPNDEIAIAHDDDLKRIVGLDVLTADAVENFLYQNETPIESEKGAALLASEDAEVPEEEKMIFHAQANVGDEPIPLVIHPVLMDCLLDFDVPFQPLDYDFELLPKELLCSAVHPPVKILILENEQGLPQSIEVHESDKGWEIGVTVEDVLKTISIDLRKSSSQHELATLDEDTRREVEDAFTHRAAGSTEERTVGIRRIDYLRGSTRLQVLPKRPFLEEDRPFDRTSCRLRRCKPCLEEQVPPELREKI